MCNLKRKYFFLFFLILPLSFFLYVTVFSDPKTSFAQTSCNAHYSLNPSSPQANTNVSITTSTTNSSNLNCVVLYNDGQPASCSVGSPAGTYNCNFNSGNPGQHTLQLKFGQADKYPAGTDCREEVVCNSVTYQTQSPPVPTLPAPGDVSSTCASSGTSWTVNWNAVTEATSYILRFNKEPYTDWMNTAGGDFAPSVPGSACTNGRCSYTVNVAANANYNWSIQPIRTGEDNTTSNQRAGGDLKCVPISSAPSISPAPNTDCGCNAPSLTEGTCTSGCTFEKYSDVNYSNPIKCNLSSSLFNSTPTSEQKTNWCRTTLRTKGDANGDGAVNNLDYFYYVSAVNGGKIPQTANADFNGDGEVGSADRAIIMKTLRP